jgi:hypothetical protein
MAFVCNNLFGFWSASRRIGFEPARPGWVEVSGFGFRKVRNYKFETRLPAGGFETISNIQKWWSWVMPVRCQRI